MRIRPALAVLLLLSSCGDEAGSGGPAGAPVIESFSCSPARGGAPLFTTCTFSVMDRENRPLSCALDVNADGTFEYTLPVCGKGSFQAHTYPAPGRFTAVLRAQNDTGLRSEARFEVEALDLPNQPPAIAAFSATPEKGLAPLATTFRWDVSDPDGEPLTCLIDIGVDGAFEYTLSGCSSQTTQAHTFNAVGQYDVALIVRDARGLSANRAVIVSANPKTEVDVRVTRTELGQSVFRADPKLIPNKPAMFRAYVLANKANTPAVTVKVAGSANGTSLGELTMNGPSVLPTAEVHADLSQSYRVMLPAEWVVPGLVLEVKVDPDNQLEETVESNNLTTVTPRLGRATVLHVTAVPIVQQGLTGAPFNFQNALWRVWPIQSSTVNTRAAYTFSGQVTCCSGSSWSSLLNAMSSLRQADGSRRTYYGFVKVNYGSGIAGMGYVGHGIAAGRDDSLSTMVHELGHTFGREHAPCGVSGDPNYPYAGAKIGSLGFDIQTQTSIDPTRYVDTMSYCDPVWISDYTYNGAQSFLERNPPQSLVPGVPEPLVLVSGRLGVDGFELMPVQRLVGVRVPVEPGPYALRIVAGESVREVPFETQKVADFPEEHFAITLPDPGPISAIELVKSGEVLHRREAPAAKAAGPVEFREGPDRLTLRWDARTHPYALVAHLGQERTTLGLWLTGGHVELPTEGLGLGGQWEVSLSDGFNAVRRVYSR